MSNSKIKALKLSKSANSTLQKVVKMIEEEQNCQEIIQQLNSVTGLIETVKKEVLECYLDACLSNEDKDKCKEDLLKIFTLKK